MLTHYPIPSRALDPSTRTVLQTASVADLLAGEPLLLPVPRVAYLLGLTRSVAYDLVARAVLPSRRLSARRIVVPRLALVQWLLESDADTSPGAVRP